MEQIPRLGRTQANMENVFCSDVVERSSRKVSSWFWAFD